MSSIFDQQQLALPLVPGFPWIGACCRCVDTTFIDDRVPFGCCESCVREEFHEAEENRSFYQWWLGASKDGGPGQSDAI